MFSHPHYDNSFDFSLSAYHLANILAIGFGQKFAEHRIVFFYFSHCSLRFLMFSGFFMNSMSYQYFFVIYKFTFESRYVFPCLPVFIRSKSRLEYCFRQIFFAKATDGQQIGEPNDKILLLTNLLFLNTFTLRAEARGVLFGAVCYPSLFLHYAFLHSL